MLESVSEERVNIVNANIIAQSRGLKIMEQKNTSCENYASLITAQLKTDLGTTAVGGTMMRGEPHIVRVNDYWLDLMPSGGYLLFIDHMDRPGFIGEVGTITGNASINISSMHLSRLKPQGRAILVLELDEPLDEQGLQQIEAIQDVCTARLAKL